MSIVALVEDESVDVIAVRRALHKAELSCPVEVFADGEDALAAARSGRFPARCFLVLDLNLPRLPGLELLQTLQREQHLSGCGVAVFTSSTADADRQRARSLGVSEYLVKGTQGSLARLVDLIRDFSVAANCQG